jgi:diguanylate cyclase (GGDEF)-like protein/PAS domain S-box-containing protein
MTTGPRPDRRAQFAFASAVAILLAVGAFSYRGLVASTESDRGVRHTHEILKNLNGLLFAIATVDSSSRGFALTGEEVFLEPYHAGKSRAGQHEATLRALTAETPEQQRYLPALEKFAERKIRFAEEVIGLRRTQGFEAAAERIRGGLGERVMVEFRAAARELEGAELRLLVQRDADAKQRLRQSETGMIFGTLLGLLITAAAGLSVHRGISRRGLAEARYRGLLEAAPDAMVVVNPAGEIVLLNVQAEKQFGYRRDELLGRRVTNIVPEGFAERLHADGLRSAAEALAQQIGTGIELTGLRKNGSRFPVELMLSPLESAGGILVTAAIRDISVRKESEGKIAHLNRVYAVLSGINTLIVRVRDRDELFREACRIAIEAGGFRMAWIGMVDRRAMKLVPVASAGVDEALMTALKGRFSLSGIASLDNSVTARAIREKKAVVSNDSQSDPEVGLAGKHAAAGIRSIAILPLIVSEESVGTLALYAGESEFFHAEEMKLLTELAGDIAFAIDHIEKRERLDYLAYYDVLTGLANRRLFLDRMAQYMRSASGGGHKLALFLIDLERFKNINDSLGQPAGDLLLKQVAQWLTHNEGESNLVARIDADHFAVVLPEVKQERDGARLLEKTIEAFMEHPFRLDEAVFRIAIKVGVAVFPQDGTDAEVLFRNAEAALKKAKARGDRYLFYTQEMNEAVAGKLTLENQLRRALENEEYVLHYQPKVSLRTGKLTGAEALIRWNDPRTGLVPPGRFIPILEETGLIYEVGRWALRRAVEDYLRWRAAGLPAVRIAVNVSPLQLRNRGFVAEIERATGVDPRAAAGLELEITESLIMENVSHNVDTLKAIRAMGVTIAIDDFGTGFSSLSYLSKLPVDTLKIDRSFIVDMTAGPDGTSLVSTIISLAHSLKLKVVAEGVETEDQSRLLRLLHCDEMQGYLFSRPVPAAEFEAKFLTAATAGVPER